MSIAPRNRDEVIATATRIAAKGGSPEALERLGTLVGVDTTELGKGEGELDSVMVVLMLPTTEVARLLPLGLQLAPNPLSPVGKHPVIVQLSHDRFEFGDMDYDEMMLAVPYVQLSSFDAPRRGPFIYMPRLYLNAELPRLLGVCLYGYEKQEATIVRDFPEAPGSEGSYRVSDSDGGTLVAATMTASGSRAHPSTIACFAQLRQLLEMPLISQAARIWNADAASSDELSPFLASNLVYAFDDPSTWIEPMKVELSVGSAFDPHGLTGSYAVPALCDGAWGGFRISVKLGVALPSSPAALRYPVPKPARRQRVLVLGGGPAACAAAYWLARQTDRYEVQMYTQGFRLGGKCAAGRNTEADARIEEHGLHAFLGFYENAFRTVRSVYATAGIPIAGEVDGKLEPLGGGFIGSNQNGLMIERKGQWKYFRTPLEPNRRVPGYVPEDARGDDGDDPDASDTSSVSGMGELIVQAVRHALRQTEVMEKRNELASRALAHTARAREPEGVLARLVGGIRDFADDLTDELRWTPSRLVQYIMRFLEDRATLLIEGWLAEGPHGPLRPVLEVMRLLIRALDEKVAEHGDDDEVWYRWMSLSSVLTAVAGLIEDGVTHLEQLDGEDMWAWFKRHDLDPRLLPEGLRDAPVVGGCTQGSPAIAAVYETLFAHGREHAEPRDLSAGVGLRWFFLAAVGYSGFPAYEFKYSCPQTLLTPYYEALTGPLGAKIHFFHRTTELRVEGTGEARRLVGVKLRKQATVKAGSAAYDPFLPDPPPNNPAALPPWPIVPNYEQLEEGEALRAGKVDLESPYSPWPGVEEVELLHGRDFDVCILGISLGALPSLTEALWKPEASTHDPRWTRMLEDIAITQTISMQLWFNRSEDELYDVPDDVNGDPGTGRGLLTGYVLPEPSMGDFAHLVEWEGWPQSNRPKFLAYHTGSLTAKSVFELPPFSEHGYPAQVDAQWRAQARTWLKDNHAAFYGKAPSGWPEFLDCLVVPDGAGAAADRFEVQYFNAGPLPSDRYVLSQPKGMAARMGQMESGVSGLYLCGDWTRTDLNCGCVEAATQSGMLCARGLSGHPVYVWHPGV